MDIYCNIWLQFMFTGLIDVAEKEAIQDYNSRMSRGRRIVVGTVGLLSTLVNAILSSVRLKWR